MLTCEISPYAYDPDSEPGLALTDANAVLASADAESEAWLNEQDWHPMSAAAAQSSTSSGGVYRLVDGQTNPQTNRLEEGVALTDKMVAFFGTEALRSYSVTAEVKAAEQASAIDLRAAARNELRFQLPDGSYVNRPFSQTIFDVTQLSDEWTPVEGALNSISPSHFVFFESEYGAFVYRNLQVQPGQPLTPEPDFSELTEALAALPSEWQRADLPSLPSVANNYAWLPGLLVHGGTASCQAGSVDGLSFDFHITQAVPRYRLNLELEVVGLSAGALDLVVHGTVLRGSKVIAPEANRLTFEKTIYSEAVEPGDLIEISEEFDYLPFNEMRGLILSDEVEFLVHSISLERIYDAEPDEQPAPEVPAGTELSLTQIGSTLLTWSGGEKHFIIANEKSQLSGMSYPGLESVLADKNITFDTHTVFYAMNDASWDQNVKIKIASAVDTGTEITVYVDIAYPDYERCGNEVFGSPGFTSLDIVAIPNPDDSPITIIERDVSLCDWEH